VRFRSSARLRQPGQRGYVVAPQPAGSHLTGCAAAADAVHIASELAANAILHSRSRAGHFTVRTELHPDHVRIEAEDLGGPWRRRQSDGRPHGLEVVEALTGADGWGTEATTGGGRIVWARLDLDAAGSEPAWRQRLRHGHDEEHADERALSGR